MKLLSEELCHNVETLTEEVNGKKSVIIEGIFAQADVVNKNQRVYPSSVLMPEVELYVKDYIIPKRAMGELDHPEGPSINLDRVSHIVTELKINKADVTGKAKILDTHAGKIVQGLIEGGVQIAVSTRGLGNVITRKDGISEVTDYKMFAIDIVGNPSAPDAYVKGIMESVDWYVDKGVLKKEQAIRVIKEDKETRLLLLKRFLNGF